MSEWPVVQPAVDRALARRGLPVRMASRLRRRNPAGVYVFLYHSIVERSRHEPWEEAYARVRTWRDDFELHMEALARRMDPLTLPEAEAELTDGGPGRPCFVVTFDDGYANLNSAVPACERLGIRPTIFVNGDRAAGRSVYYRVLLSVLESRGHGVRAAEILGAGPAESLLAHTKDRYVPAETEAATLAAWEACLPGEPLPRAHLDFDELRALVARGWSVGNHGRTHASLAALDAEGLDRELLDNQAELEREQLHPLPWIAYPHGDTRHVDRHVGAWLDRHPELRGIFGDGGVNLVPTRTEWLRVPVSRQTVGQLDRRIRAHHDATERALASLSRVVAPPR